MGGKAAVILVLGFSSLMLVVGLNMNRVSTSSAENASTYYDGEIAKEIARSGINLAAANLSRNRGWHPKSKYSYNGEDNLEIKIERKDSTIILTSTGTYNNDSKTIELKIRSLSFSYFAYFSNIEGNIWWTGGDSVLGPFHTNDKVQFKDHPYFAGPTTSHVGSPIYYSSKSKDAPTVVGDYIPNSVERVIPPDGIDNLKGSAKSDGYIFKGNSTVFLEFAGDSIRYKFSSSDDYTTVLGKDLAPNGVIYAEDANLRIKGTVKGKWSVGCNKDVYIDDDVVYSDVPNYKDEYDDSNDLLGIIAKNNVQVTNNSANSDEVNIHAAIYCQEGSFTAEDYKSRSVAESINLIGGITQYKRGGVGTFSSYYDWYKKKYVTYAKSGFKQKNYKYDSRLLHLIPPFFPATNEFEILSWLE